MDLNEITEIVRAEAARDLGQRKTIKLDLGADGCVVLDMTCVPHVVSNEDRATDATVRVSLAHLEALRAGRLRPVSAYMTGKLKILGDMNIAMKLQNIGNALIGKRP